MKKYKPIPCMIPYDLRSWLDAEYDFGPWKHFKIQTVAEIYWMVVGLYNGIQGILSR